MHGMQYASFPTGSYLYPTPLNPAGLTYHSMPYFPQATIPKSTKSQNREVAHVPLQSMSSGSFHGSSYWDHPTPLAVLPL